MKENSNGVLDTLHKRLEEINDLMHRMDEDAPQELMRLILDADAVFVSGKGRSGYIASCLAMRLMQMGFTVHVPGEATCPRIGPKDLMVAVSCSGQTVTTTELARISNNSGADVVAVTADASSPLAETSDHIILVPVQGGDVKESHRYVIGPYNNTLFEEALLLYFDALINYMLNHEGIPPGRLQEMHTNLE